MIMRVFCQSETTEIGAKKGSAGSGAFVTAIQNGICHLYFNAILICQIINIIVI